MYRESCNLIWPARRVIVLVKAHCEVDTTTSWAEMAMSAKPTPGRGLSKQDAAYLSLSRRSENAPKMNAE
jgi:hypothetical protein